MSEENKGGGFFSFIWKCMITFLMFYGIAYALGYDQKLLEFLKNDVIPDMQEKIIKPATEKAKVIATEAAVIAKEKGGEALEIGKKAAREAASDLSTKAMNAVNKAKNDITREIEKRM